MQLAKLENTMQAFTRNERGMLRPSGTAPRLEMTAEQIEAARGAVREVVTHQERHDKGPFDFGSGYEDGSLDRMIGSLYAIRGRIPEQYRSNARCEISSQSGYDGDHSPTIEVQYKRPETDEEVVERLSWEAYMRSLTEAEERATLAALQAKYAAPPLPDKD
jgi:hypothetical protein